MEKEEKLLNYQLITSIAFIVSLIISIILTYDEKKELLNEETIFSKDFDKYLNLFNRILALSIVCFILYINYETYKINKNKNTSYECGMTATGYEVFFYGGSSVRILQE